MAGVKRSLKVGNLRTGTVFKRELSGECKVDDPITYRGCYWTVVEIKDGIAWMGEGVTTSGLLKLGRPSEVV